MSHQHATPDALRIVATHDSRLVEASDRADEHRLEHCEYPEKNQVCRVLVPLPVDAEEADKAPDKGDVDDPSVLAHKAHRGGLVHHQRDRGGEEQLDEEDRVHLADERETDLGVAVDDVDADLEVVGQVIFARLRGPRIGVETAAGGCLGLSGVEERLGLGGVRGTVQLGLLGLGRHVGVRWRCGHGE